MTTRKAFTLIELMVTMMLIAIVATISMPQVDEWISRQQARRVAAQLISDISKARLLAGNNYIADNTTGSGARANQTALYTKKENNQTSYWLLTRNGPETTSWNPVSDTVVRRVDLPGRVDVKRINRVTFGSLYTFAFTSSGIAKTAANDALTVPTAMCENVYTPFPPVLAFEFTVASRFSAEQNIHYMVEVSRFGEYRVCQSIGFAADFAKGFVVKSL